MDVQEVLASLAAQGDDARAASAQAYHKSTRPFLGVPNPALNDLARDLRQTLTTPDRLSLADALWQTDIHEARILAAKTLTQARIRPDDTDAWTLITAWVPDFDGWAIADHVCSAGSRRLLADPSRLEQVETWTHAPDKWVRRAALVITLPWTKQNHPKPDDLARRDLVLTWAARYVPDTDWFIQKAIAWWLRDLSRHDPDRTRAFLDQHGGQMKPFAAREAARHMPAP